jgi:hypothetical protein
MKTNMVGIYFVLWTVVILPSLITAAPLDEYIYTPDPYYHFTEISATNGPGYTLYLYNMTSLASLSSITSSYTMYNIHMDIGYIHYLYLTIL